MFNVPRLIQVIIARIDSIRDLKVRFHYHTLLRCMTVTCSRALRRQESRM